jgi:hypothetical protein
MVRIAGIDEEAETASLLPETLAGWTTTVTGLASPRW